MHRKPESFQAAGRNPESMAVGTQQLGTPTVHRFQLPCVSAAKVTSILFFLFGENQAGKSFRDVDGLGEEVTLSIHRRECNTESHVENFNQLLQAKNGMGVTEDQSGGIKSGGKG